MADNVWDLSKAIESTSLLKRSDSDPGLLRASILKASDIAHPGGFRRNYMTNNHNPSSIVSSRVKSQVQASIFQVYIPFIHSMLSQDHEIKGLSLCDRIECLLEAKNENERSILIERGSGSSLKQALLALLKAFVGTGILFLPHGFQSGGILFSPLVLILVAYLTLYAMLRLLVCKALVGGTYGHIGYVALGRVGQRMVQISIVFMQMGFCCTYIIFVATNLCSVLSYYGISSSISKLILLQAIVYIPLSWIRHINYFAFSNLIADVCILYGLAYIVLQSGILLVEQGVQEDVHLFNPVDYPIFIGTAVFTFEGIGLVIPTQSALAPSAKPDFEHLLTYTIIGLLLFYTGFSTINYMAYGSTIAPIVTSSLVVNGWSVSVQLGYSIAQLLSYPLFLFPVVNIVEETLLFPRQNLVSSFELMKRTKTKNGVRSCIVLLTILIAYYGQDRLDLFVSLVGAVCCVPLSFIYPPLFCLKLFPNAPFWTKVQDMTVMMIGFSIFLFVTYSNVQKWIYTEN